MSKELSPVAMIVMGPPARCLACIFQQSCEEVDPNGEVRREHPDAVGGHAFAMGMATFAANMMSKHMMILCEEHFDDAKGFLEQVGQLRNAMSPEAKGPNL